MGITIIQGGGSGSSGGGGSSGGDEARWDLLKPPAPTSVTASAGNAQATVSWTAPTGVLAQAPVTDYVVEFQPSGGSWTPFAESTSTATSAVVTGLTNGTPHVFRAAAKNGIGQGPWSSQSNSVTPMDNPITSATGLYAWYDASSDSALFSAQSGGSVVTADGGSIYRVQDMSGNGRHLRTYSDNPSVAPTLGLAAKNGKNVLTFNNESSGSALQTAANRESGTFSVSHPFSLFAVWRPQTSSTGLIYGLGYSWGDQEYSTVTQITYSQGTLYMAQPYGSGVTWGSSTSFSQDSWICTRFIFNGTNSQMVVNGVSTTPGGGFSSNGSDPSNYNFTRGCADFRISGRYQIGEMVFFSGALSSTAAANIETFLMQKWGIT